MTQLKLPSERKRIQAEPGYREIFTHSTAGEFDITETRDKIKRERARFEPYLCKVQISQLTDFILRTREIDQARVMELILVDTDSLKDPALAFDMPDGTQLITDGHHRVLALELLEHKYCLMYIIPLSEAVLWTAERQRQLEAETGILLGERPWGEYDVIPGQKGFIRRQKP